MTEEPNIELVEITPEVAAEWLTLNRLNRPLKERQLNLYAIDMAAGHWQMTGEPIKFNVDGDLLDGQHRLAAVVQSGVTVKMLVIRGLRSSSQDVMDTGMKRSASDALSLAKVDHSTMIAGAARLGINWDLGNLTSTSRRYMAIVSNSQVLSWVEANPDVISAAEFIKDLPGRIPAKNSSLVWTYTMLHRIDAEEADDFYLSLAEMRTTGTGDPRYALLRRLNTAREMGDSRMTNVVEAWCLFRAWNAVRDGETMGKLVSRGKAGNVAFPVPR